MYYQFNIFPVKLCLFNLVGFRNLQHDAVSGTCYASGGFWCIKNRTLMFQCSRQRNLAFLEVWHVFPPTAVSAILDSRPNNLGRSQPNNDTARYLKFIQALYRNLDSEHEICATVNKLYKIACKANYFNWNKKKLQ